MELDFAITRSSLSPDKCCVFFHELTRLVYLFMTIVTVINMVCGAMGAWVVSVVFSLMVGFGLAIDWG